MIWALILIEFIFMTQGLKYDHVSFIFSVLNFDKSMQWRIYQLYFNSVILVRDYIGGVTVNLLATSAVDRGFEPWSGHIKDNKLGICCFSLQH